MERTQLAVCAGTEQSGKNPEGRIHAIRRDRLMGMLYTQIAEKYQIDPRTAKRYAENNLPLVALEHRPFPSILDPYKLVILRWLTTEPLSARVVWIRLREMGCMCGYTIVNDYVKKAKNNLVAYPTPVSLLNT